MRTIWSAKSISLERDLSFIKRKKKSETFDLTEHIYFLIDFD